MFGGLCDEVLQPAFRAGFAGDTQVFVTDHVEQKKTLHTRGCAVRCEFGGEVAAAVEAVFSVKGLDGFLQIGPDKPDLHFGFVCGERVGKSQQYGRAGTAVVGSGETGLEERVVVAGENEDLLLRIGAHVELTDDVMDSDRTARGPGSEVIRLDLAARPDDHLPDEVLRLFVTGRTGPALTESHDLRGVVESLLRVEVFMQRCRVK